ncbi:MAG: type II secretion system protein GspE, partial [Xanthomonadales bacterium]|nr:type II secretion system protein GspE [Xanthomonadales bacterium]
QAETYEALPELVAEFGLERFTDERPIKLYKPIASAANPSGYFGRTTIMEFLVMSDAIRRQVMQHAGMADIEHQAQDEGMRTMYEDGLVKSLRGVTTVEEVLRVTQEG